MSLLGAACRQCSSRCDLAYLEVHHSRHTGDVRRVREVMTQGLNSGLGRQEDVVCPWLSAEAPSPY